MKPSDAAFGWPHPNFNQNRAKFPAEELWKYIGQQVAWSWDGSRILAGASNHDELLRKLTAAGIDPQQVVYSYVDDPNVSHLG